MSTSTIVNPSLLMAEQARKNRIAAVMRTYTCNEAQAKVFIQAMIDGCNSSQAQVKAEIKKSPKVY